MRKSAKEKGFVYILTNDSFREDWVKIGKSNRPVDVRSKELDNTAVPLPFKIYATLKTAKFNEVEKSVHTMIDALTKLRIRRNREFFNVPPQKALEILKIVAMPLDDAEITQYKDNKPILPEHPGKPSHKPNFRFSQIGLKQGDIIVFRPTGKKVRIADDRHIEHEGKQWTLSGFTKVFLPESMRNASGAYQGPLFFTYFGKTLVEWRAQAEAKSDQEKGEAK